MGISDTLGGIDEWITSLENLQQLAPYATDKTFQDRFIDIKRQNKAKLRAWIKEHTGDDVPLDALYDVQVKRIHEYKRQLMNILYVIHRYLAILDTPQGERRSKFVPRVVCIGGKAAPGYHNAKAIIKLITAVGAKVNHDPSVGDLLKVIFLPNYNVSSAQVIIPAAELSQHISTAGTEASGTSNMKFVMNGGLIVGTMDGANVEIREECGHDTMFIFGCLENEVPDIKKRAAEGHYPIDARLQTVFDAIKQGDFSCNEPTAHEEFCELVDKLMNIREAGTWNGDRYLVCHDFPSFIDAQNRVDKIYKEDKKKWLSLSIQAASSMAQFSTDRTIREYASVIWDVKPAPRPVGQAADA